jgi:hypothetical protein
VPEVVDGLGRTDYELSAEFQQSYVEGQTKLREGLAEPSGGRNRASTGLSALSAGPEREDLRKGGGGLG